MGLYGCKIRDEKTALEIPAILRRHGYVVFFEGEQGRGRHFSCKGKGRPLTFWISMDRPLRFYVYMGRVGTQIVRVLGTHGVFAPESDTSDEARKDEL